MEHAELVALIRNGITEPGGRWAELGAGTGAFTAALADLLGPGARITAVDRDRRALRTLEDRLGARAGLTLDTVEADFTRPLGLSQLDGILMANSLHFVRRKEPVLAAVHEMLRPGGTLLLVEYGSDRGNPWVPHPLSFSTWEATAEAAGFADTRLVGTRPDRHLGSMYAAASTRP
ncbi:MAG TPA: class I SAM-dependent methyltransferase [Candidatus Dormibacteraeota bacterium]